VESNVADENVLLVLGLHGGDQWSGSCKASGYVTIQGSAGRDKKKLRTLARNFKENCHEHNQGSQVEIF
jgi:hypothetical protein